MIVRVNKWLLTHHPETLTCRVFDFPCDSSHLDGNVPASHFIEGPKSKKKNGTAALNS